MSHREKIRRLFKLTRQDSEYVRYAQSLVFENSAEACPEELERCGDRFLELMVSVYAKKFDEAKIDALITKHEDNLMQEFSAFDDMLQPEVELFFAREYSIILETDASPGEETPEGAGESDWEEREITVVPGARPPGTLLN